MVADEPIITRRRAPGVELATWAGDGRCVLAHLGVATYRWLQVADVIVYPPGPMCLRRWAVMTALPGCLVVAGEMNGFVSWQSEAATTSSSTVLARRLAL